MARMLGETIPSSTSSLHETTQSDDLQLNSLRRVHLENPAPVDDRLVAPSISNSHV